MFQPLFQSYFSPYHKHNTNLMSIVFLYWLKFLFIFSFLPVILKNTHFQLREIVSASWNIGNVSFFLQLYRILVTLRHWTTSERILLFFIMVHQFVFQLFLYRHPRIFAMLEDFKCNSLLPFVVKVVMLSIRKYTTPPVNITHAIVNC